MDPEGAENGSAEKKGGTQPAGNNKGLEGAQPADQNDQKLSADLLRATADKLEESGIENGAEMAALLRAFAQFLYPAPTEDANKAAGNTAKPMSETV